MTRSLRARYGEWALVAGASPGFGASFAAELAGQGMNVVLVSRQSDRLGELAQHLRANHGVETRCLVFDLAEQDAVASIGSAVSDLDLGILVYNAAYVPVGRFLDVGEEVLEQVVRVNVRGPLLLVRALLPGMSARGRGAVVLVSSLAGLHGAPRVAAYSASKAFNNVLAEALWGELNEQGIDVSVCCAGAMPTPGYLASTDWKSPGMLSPDEAARQTLDALGKGPRIVPGRINRLSAQFMGRLLTRKAAIRLIAKNTLRLS